MRKFENLPAASQVWGNENKSGKISAVKFVFE